MKNTFKNRGQSSLIAEMMMIIISVLLIFITFQSFGEISTIQEVIEISGYVVGMIGFTILSSLVIYYSIVTVSGSTPIIKEKLRCSKNISEKYINSILQKVTNIIKESTDTVTEQEAIKILYRKDEIDINELELSVEKLLDKQDTEFSYEKYEDLPDRNPDHKIAKVEEQDNYYYWSEDDDKKDWSRCQSLNNIQD